MVQLGDASFEESLTALSEPESAQELEPQAAHMLELVCLGLCGEWAGRVGGSGVGLGGRGVWCARQ